MNTNGLNLDSVNESDLLYYNMPINEADVSRWAKDLFFAWGIWAAKESNRRRISTSFLNPYALASRCEIRYTTWYGTSKLYVTGENIVGLPSFEIGDRTYGVPEQEVRRIVSLIKKQIPGIKDSTICTLCGKVFPSDARVNESVVCRLCSRVADTNNKKAAFVYMLGPQNGSNASFYKIGMSKNPKDRLSFFSARCPFPLSIIHQFPADDAYAAERRLHTRFAALRTKDEWFSLSSKDVDYVLSIQEYRDEMFIESELDVSAQR